MNHICQQNIGFVRLNSNKFNNHEESLKMRCFLFFFDFFFAFFFFFFFFFIIFVDSVQLISSDSLSSSSECLTFFFLAFFFDFFFFFFFGSLDIFERFGEVGSGDVGLEWSESQREDEDEMRFCCSNPECDHLS